jgi:ribonuclease P protein subunit Rpp30 (EC 3.1.26.5)
MYEAVAAYPAGDSTVSRQAKTAADYGYDGLVVRTRTAEFDADAISDRYGIDVVGGIEIDAADPEAAAGAVGNHRPECPVLLVRGGTDALNRYAVEADRVDVLSRPLAGDGDFNHVLARAAATNRVFIEFDLGVVLRKSGGPRVQALKGLRKLRELVEQYDTPFVVSATADSHRGLRAPRELRAVGEQIGFRAEQITAGLRAWGEIVARNRERSEERFIEPGVRRGRYES